MLLLIYQICHIFLTAPQNNVNRPRLSRDAFHRSPDRRRKPRAQVYQCSQRLNLTFIPFYATINLPSYVGR